MKPLARRKFIRLCATFLAGSSLVAACGETAQTSPTANSIPTRLPPTPAPSTSTKPATVGLSSPTIAPPPPTLPNLTPTSVATNPTTAPTAPPTANPQPTAPAFTLEQKVGQRLLAVLPGTELTAAVTNFLLKVRPGGILMFAANISSLAQIKKLNADLQALAAKNGMPPFIITLDEEGGIVSRMPPDGQNSLSPAQMAQAAGGLEAVKDCARETAIRLTSLGFNLNLAPDADVNSNPANPVIGTRSFGSDPKNVAQAVQAAIGEYLGQGIGTCVKHFPGHGDTNVDSHSGLPIVRKSRAELDQFELVPFRAAIEAGTPFIMSAHILFPQLEPNGLPATLSPYFLKKVLRDELKYPGIVITDSLSMGAITNKYGLAEAGRLALVAGADMIIAVSDLEGQLGIFNNLVAAAKRGEFDLDQPVERILTYKNKYARTTAQPKTANPAKIEAAAQASITALRSDGKTLPLNAKKPLLVNLALAQPTQVEGRPPSTLLSELWREKFPNQPILEISVEPTAAEIDRAVRSARPADAVVIVTRDAYDNSPQVELVKALLALNIPAVVVAVRGPYDLLSFPGAANYLTSYSDVPASARAVIAALTGTIPIKGKLPVALPGLFEVGAGLTINARS